MEEAQILPNTGVAKPKVKFTKYQVFVVALLAFLQFSLILDFMILSPLGAILMPELKVEPSQFGLIVSVYAFSAGLSGILAAGIADRFDRKSLLTFYYVGFIIGTLLCAIADSYEFLLFARMVTGLFAGVIGSIVFAITTDLFPFEARGRVMGFIQTAFAASQILGIPIGLYLANHWGWHMPFFLIVGVSIVAAFILVLKLKPLRGHLRVKEGHANEHPLKHLWRTVSTPRYLQAFVTVGLLSTGGFMLMPFGSAFSVHNLGLEMGDLPSVYLVTGLCSILVGPMVGRLSDRFGKFKMFMVGTCISIVMVLIYTHLGKTPIAMVMLINAVMFVGISSRMIPSQALMSAVPTPDQRGSFMAISSSVQQVSGGFAAMIAGLIVHEGVDGKLEHFENIGFVVVGTSLVTLFMMYHLHKYITEKLD